MMEPIRPQNDDQLNVQFVDETVIFETDFEPITFSAVNTSGDTSLCGYNAIANYIKFLPRSKRLECYRQLLQKTWDKNYEESRHYVLSRMLTNPFESLTDELKLKLLFIEEFFKLRESEAYHDYLDCDAYSAQADDQDIQNIMNLALINNEEIDQRLFEQAKENFLAKYSNIYQNIQATINSLQYGDKEFFFKEFFLKSGCTYFPPDIIGTDRKEENKIISYQVQDGSYSIIEFYRRSPLQNSYQLWLSTMMGFLRQKGTLIEIQESEENFNSILPNNSFIFFRDLDLAVREGQKKIANNLFCCKNKQLKAIETECKNNNADERISVSAQITAEEYKKIFYLAFKKILDQLSRHLAGVEGDKKFHHFLKKADYENFFKIDGEAMTEALKQLNANIELPQAMAQDGSSIIKDLNAEKIFQIALNQFKKEFSFERQYYHAINSDPLLVKLDTSRSAHFISYIAQDKLSNPFPNEDTIQSLYLDSINQEKITQDVKQTLNFFIDKEAEKFTSAQSQSMQLSSLFDERPSSSPSINTSFRSSSLFQKLKGRQDDNLRYRVLEGELDNEPIHERISRAIDQSKLLNSADGVTDAVTQEITDDEILLAMLLAKNFGGIGTKIDQIFSADGDQLDQERQALVDFLKSQDQEGSPCVNEALFNKLVNFSANFQIQCKELGIYSGNNAIDEKDFLDQASIEIRHGLRLAFIPD